MIKLPYPWEPSICIKTIKPPVAIISEVDCLKETIKKLEKENAGLRSILGKATSEKDALKASLSPKRERFNKADTDIQIEHNKRRKVGDALKGSFETIANKKKQLLKKAYAVMFLHNTLCAVFHFVSVCRVVMERIKYDLYASSLR